MSESILYDSPYEPGQTPRPKKAYNTPRPTTPRPFNPRPTLTRSNIKDRNRKLDLAIKKSPYQTRDSPRFRKKKTKTAWTFEETEFLRKGMETFGNDWVAIKSFYSLELTERSNVDLKDRARNVKNMLKREKQDLGIWENAGDIKK